MSTASNKAIALSRELASKLKRRFPTTTVLESTVAADGCPLITMGTGVAGSFGAVIKTISNPVIGTDVIGLASTTFTPSTIQLVTEIPAVQSKVRIVRLATAAALPACTAAGTGPGKTLTADAVGALTVDGVAVANDDLILVKNQAAAKDNGIYTVTEKGVAVTTAFVLTRATTFDAASATEISIGATALVTAGSANALLAFELTTTGTITVDTTALTFVQLANGMTNMTAQQMTDLLGEVLGRNAMVEWYAAPAGNVPSTTFISSTYLGATYKDIYWNIQNSQ